MASLLAKRGAKVLDADRIAHEHIQPKGESFNPILKVFGPGILIKGKIDHKKLGMIVFKNRGALKRLEKIIHPAVVKTIRDEINKYKKNRKSGVVVLDVPLLFESGLNRYADVVIVVKATQVQQIERAQKRLNINKKQALGRIRSQMPLSSKIRLADFIIDNRGNLKETKKQVEKIWRELSLRIKS